MLRHKIKINGEQRSALYSQVRNHLSALGDVFLAMECDRDSVTAERLGREFSQDFRLLEDIGWAKEDDRDRIELTMHPGDLAPLLERLRMEAKGGLADAIKEREEVAGEEIIDELESTMKACDAVLVYLESEQ
jgi:hypothetical protein